MLSHQQARDILRRAAIARGIAEPSIALLQAAGAVALHESSYGAGWRGRMVGSRNWGAVQCGHLQDAHGDCGPGCRPCTDSHADATEYPGCFREYASDDDAASDLLRILLRDGIEEPSDMGNAKAVATTMWEHHYYEARGDREHAIGMYRDAVMKCAATIAAAHAEPVCLSPDGETWTAVRVPGVD